MVPLFGPVAGDPNGPLRFTLTVPTWPAPAKTTRHLNSRVPAVLLSFDAGADRGHTKEILDTLRAEGVIAAFGLTGTWAQANPDLVRRIHREGHGIVNHTWSHSSMTRSGMSREQRLDEITRTDAVISAITGESTRPWFRPPFGEYNSALESELAEEGYSINLMWTIDTLGWRGLDPERIVERSLEQLRPGAVILMHVGEQSQDVAAVRPLLEALRERHYVTAGLPLMQRLDIG